MSSTDPGRNRLIFGVVAGARLGAVVLFWQTGDSDWAIGVALPVIAIAGLIAQRGSRKP